ncbi:MAG: response regulator transcription factor [Bacteroidota bacterium]
MKILLVDDNQKMRSMVRELIGARSHDFYEASDGAVAVQCYLDYRPDMVVMDIELSAMDGLTATKKIIEKDANANIIVLTTYNTAAYRDAAMSAGAKHFFGKENLMSLRSFVSGMTQ